MSFYVYDGGRFIHYLKVRPRPIVWLEPLERRVLYTTVTLGAPVNTNISDSLFPASSVAVGDLNGDSIPDVVSSRLDDEAQVYLGTAAGALNAQQIVATGGTPIALGDFNNDSNLDLATNNGILPGKGDGTFGTAITGFTLPANTVNLYAQDMNGDGNLDLVASTFIAANTQKNPNPIIEIVVMLGNGNGTFQTPKITQVGTAAGLTSASANFAFGDFNNDGNLDVLTPFGIMPGTGNGAFGTAVPLPFPGTSTSAFNSAVYAVDDFNGDSNLDVVTLPPNGSTGQIDVFLGTGALGFSTPTIITVSSGSTITSMTAADMNGDGNVDLLVGLSNTTTNAGSVALLLNSGSGTFAAPVLYSLPGTPLYLTARAFTTSGNADLLAIDTAAGATATTTLASTASVLLNSQAAGITPTLTLTSSENPAIAGDAVRFTANVHAPNGSSQTTPTGSVTFSNGGSPLGTVALASGKAVLKVSATGVGIENITFAYSGDSTFASATSATLQQVVLSTAAKQPLILPTIGAVTLPSQFLTGDHGAITLTLTNGGNASANGRVAVQLYLSTDGAIDSSSIAIQSAALANQNVQLGRGRSKTFTANFVAGVYPAGTYQLIAELAPVARFTDDEVSSVPVTASGTFQALGKVFGTVGVHHGITLKAIDGVGNRATLSMTGPGYATLTNSGAVLNITLSGTTSATAVNIASSGAFNLGAVVDGGVLGTLSASRTILTTGVALTGGAKKVTFAAVDGTGRVSLTIGAASPVTLSLGSVATAELQSSAVIKSLTASSWSAGEVDAPAITNLSISRAFAANVNTHNGGAVQTARVGGLTGGTWAVSGGVGSLKVLGSVTGASIFAGADSGADDILGTADDSFAATVIGSINILGADAGGLFIAGGSFPLGVAPTTSTLTSLLAKGGIRQITVRGAVDSTARFLAAKLPSTALLAGASVKTKVDSHFAV